MQEYLFPVKRYGWGWGFPITWQGWLVFVGFFLLLVAGAFLFPPRKVLAAYLIYVTVLSAALIGSFCVDHWKVVLGIISYVVAGVAGASSTRWRLLRTGPYNGRTWDPGSTEKKRAR